FGKARTAPMPGPYLIIRGEMPLGFFAAIVASRCPSIQPVVRKFRQAYPRPCKPVKVPRRALVWPWSEKYIRIHEAQGWIECGRRPNDDRAKNRVAADRGAALSLSQRQFLRHVEQGSRQALVPEYDQQSRRRNHRQRRETIVHRKAGRRRGFTQASPDIARLTAPVGTGGFRDQAAPITILIGALFFCFFLLLGGLLLDALDPLLHAFHHGTLLLHAFLNRFLGLCLLLRGILFVAAGRNGQRQDDRQG